MWMKWIHTTEHNQKQTKWFIKCMLAHASPKFLGIFRAFSAPKQKRMKPLSETWNWLNGSEIGMCVCGQWEIPKTIYICPWCANCWVKFIHVDVPCCWTYHWTRHTNNIIFFCVQYVSAAAVLLIPQSPLQTLLHLHKHFDGKYFFIKFHPLQPLSMSFFYFCYVTANNWNIIVASWNGATRTNHTVCDRISLVHFNLFRLFRLYELYDLIVIHAALQTDLEHFKLWVNIFSAFPFNNSFFSFFGYISHKNCIHTLKELCTQY